MIAQRSTVALRPTAQTHRRYRTPIADGTIEIACASTARMTIDVMRLTNFSVRSMKKTQEPKLTSAAILPEQGIPAGGTHEP